MKSIVGSIYLAVAFGILSTSKAQVNKASISSPPGEEIGGLCGSIRAKHSTKANKNYTFANNINTGGMSLDTATEVLTRSKRTPLLSLHNILFPLLVNVMKM